MCNLDWGLTDDDLSAIADCIPRFCNIQIVDISDNNVFASMRLSLLVYLHGTQCIPHFPKGDGLHSGDHFIVSMAWATHS